MTINSTTQPQTTALPDSQESARTDDLLASGAETEDGARGFEGQAAPQNLQTGMEGIAGATVQQGNRQSDDATPGATGTAAKTAS